MKPQLRVFYTLATAIALVFCLPACTIVKVVDTAASAAIGVTKGAVKVTGAAVGAAIPDDDDDDEKDKD